MPEVSNTPSADQGDRNDLVIVNEAAIVIKAPVRIPRILFEYIQPGRHCVLLTVTLPDQTGILQTHSFISLV